MNLRRAIGPGLAVLLLTGVAIGIRQSVRDKKDAEIAAGDASGRIAVKVLTGSEKEKFLTDPELAKVLDAEGITLTAQKAGSREIATRPDLKSFDVAYPAGASAALKMALTTGSKRTFTSCIPENAGPRLNTAVATEASAVPAIA